MNVGGRREIDRGLEIGYMRTEGEGECLGIIVFCHFLVLSVL